MSASEPFKTYTWTGHGGKESLSALLAIEETALTSLLRVACEVEDLTFETTEDVMEDEGSPESQGSLKRKRQPSPSPNSAATQSEHLPTGSSIQGGASGEKKKKKRKQNTHEGRRRRREEQREQQGHVPTTNILQKIVAPSISRALSTPLDTSTLPVTRCGYLTVNRRSKPEDKVEFTKKDYLEMGYRHVPWNGVDPIPLLDDTERVFAVLGGRPRGDDYLKTCQSLYEQMDVLQKSAKLPQKYKEHIRGDYPALDAGIGYAGGSTKLFQCRLPKRAEVLVWELFERAEFRRITGFINYSFKLWAPKLYHYYKDHMDLLSNHTKYETLRRIPPKKPPGNVFSNATLNMGSKVWTTRHRDGRNLPFGWCAVVALGNFNSSTSGHLVLHSLKLVVELPPGSLVLFPSATLEHSNVCVQEGDERASLTLYSGGGIFRFIDNGFQTQGELKKASPDAYREMLEKKKARWEMGLKLWSNLQDLKA